MATAEPVINTWYRDPESEETFIVVGVNEDSETVELQNIDGDIEEISFERWYDTGYEAIDPPDDEWDSEGTDEDDEDEESEEEDDDWDDEEDDSDDEWDDDWDEEDER